MGRLPPGQTLQAALVHEAYMRLSCGSEQRWDNRGHFFASAAEAMRRILIEQARRKASLRRAGERNQVPLDEIEIESLEPDDKLMEVDAVLQELEEKSALQGQIVKLRFFAGLKHEEVGALLGISEKTVRRHWNFAKVWLYQKIAIKKVR